MLFRRAVRFPQNNPEGAQATCAQTHTCSQAGVRRKEGLRDWGDALHMLIKHGYGLGLSEFSLGEVQKFVLKSVGRPGFYYRVYP